MTKFLAIILSFTLMVSPVLAGNEGTSSAGDQFREQEAAKNKSSSYMNQILSMATGSVGTQLMVSCTLGFSQPSIPIFNAGSLIQIFAEISAGKNQQSFIKKQDDDLKMVEEKMKQTGQGGEFQKAALEAALKDEKEILSFIKKRKSLLGAVSAVFTAATAAAIIELILSKIPPFKPDIAACRPAITSALMVTAISAAFAYVKGGIQGVAAGAIVMIMMKILKVSTAALTAISAMAYNTAIARIITFGLSRQLVSGVVSDLGKKQKIAEGNIEMLQKVLDDFNKTTTPTNGIIAAADSSGTDSADTSTNGDAGTVTTSGSASGSASGTGQSSGAVSGNASSSNTNSPNSANIVSSNKFGCFRNFENGVGYSDTVCNSPIKITPPSFNKALEIPELTAASKLATDMAQSVSNGDAGKAELQAADLASRAGRLRTIEEDLTKKLNAVLIARGEKPLNIAEETQNQLKAISAQIKNDLSSDKQLSDFAAGYGPAKLAADDKDKSRTAAPDLNVGAIFLNNQNNASSANSTTGNITEGSGVLANDSDLETEKSKTLEEKLNDFEMNESDISTEKTASIFERVSARYILNYPNLLKRKSKKKDIEPAAVTP